MPELLVTLDTLGSTFRNQLLFAVSVERIVPFQAVLLLISFSVVKRESKCRLGFVRFVIPFVCVCVYACVSVCE